MLTLEELCAQKIKTLNDLIEIKSQRPKDQMVLASGCFDILHSDHVKYLDWARSLGNYLVLAINSDSSARMIKGPNRPIIRVEDRIIPILPYEFVDYILTFDESDVTRIIEKLKPQIFARGKTYCLDDSQRTEKKVPMNQDERRAVEEYGGEIKFLEGEPRICSSYIIEVIRNESGRNSQAS